MPRLAAVWSGLNDDDEKAIAVHEEGLIAASIAKNEPTARNGDRLEESPFQEVTQLDGKHMAIFDLPEEQPIEEFEARIRTSIGEVPEHAHVNGHCYRQYARFDGEYWRDDPRDVQMWCVVHWEPSPEVHDEFMDWFINEFIPGMLDSPELLRTRVFTLETASIIRGQKQEQVGKESLLRYMTIWEFENEDFPWEILVYLGSSEKWRYYIDSGLMEYWDNDERNDLENSSEDGGTDREEEDDSDSFEMR